MRLKRLELQGFKSFAAKTVLDFSSGVVAIVGPNGSGKSNVIDAVRWLLGEREAKNLRGDKSDDLIFSGTDGRTRLGFAHATMHFDNSTGFFPVDFAEVAVSRKIYRDGTSQYFLNNAEVRLKDVIDFFAGSRLGTRGLTIINQGNSDLFVRAAPAERREMIEEILGLRQFQLKRHESELKLRNTAVNLEKAQATVDELLPRLRLLRRQASKWSERANIETELRAIEAAYFHTKLADLDREFSGIAPRLAAFDAEWTVKEKELRALNDGLARIQQEKPRVGGGNSEIREQMKKVLSRRSDLQRELGRLEAKLEFVEEVKKAEYNAADLTAALKDVRRELHDVAKETDVAVVQHALAGVVAKIDELFAEKKTDASGVKDEIKKAVAAMQEELRALDKELGTLEASEAKVAEQFSAFNKVFEESFRAVERKKDELAGIQQQKSKLQFDHERVAMRRAELESRAAEAGRTLAEFQSAPATATFASMDELQTAERRMFKLRADLAAIGEIDEAMLKDAQETETRYTFLGAQIADLTKASVDLHGLINDLSGKIKNDFTGALKGLNEHFNNYFRLMFGGGKARLVVVKKEVAAPAEGEVADSSLRGPTAVAPEAISSDKTEEEILGLDIDVNLPRKGIRSLEMLSGGEKSLVSIAALFALVSISPPPFLVLDEADAALDEANTRRFANLIKEFSKKTQFVLVTHNRATMEAADVLYGVTMGADGASKVLSVKLE